MRGTTVLPGTPCAEPRAGEPPVHRLEVPLPGVLPFAIGTFDSIGPMSRASFPHRHTFHEIVHVTGGSGTHAVDLRRWPVTPPQLWLIAPGQVHHWVAARGLEGTVVLFTDEFLAGDPAARDLLRRLGERPVPLDPAADRATAGLIAELDDEYRRDADGVASVLAALLHVLLVRTARLAGTPAPAGGGTGTVAAEFVRLVGRAGLEPWLVRDYARHLGVTPGHLTEAVRLATGRTPAEHVRAARAREAMRLLVSTDLTVRRIADRVGFADPAYFCRFFRREAGVSPGDFRDKHHDRRTQSIAAPRRPS
ncbi:AraC family transcriptional regulator [Actinophytocola xinjiangensis]|uniref:AraC family transcriptional regulator n=1 Tax=Actinophytocola xinjiangensis TaxID=485602 RepID=A0A7Z0WRB8_9PSEU|nr:AraC family transcriptional regulator [Actinophytocola xinjiangensis]OLF13935.1 AraC family transcriptional regulator [Actinophytocola xinjiangensis]